MPKPTLIAEAALYVDDLERAVRFYTDLFECLTIRRDERFAALRIAEGQVLLLFRRGQSTGPIHLEGGTIPGHDGSGPAHVCFGIGAGEVAAWEGALARQGVPVESRVRWPGGALSLYFRDPDRHAVELATPGVWE